MISTVLIYERWAVDTEYCNLEGECRDAVCFNIDSGLSSMPVLARFCSNFLLLQLRQVSAAALVAALQVQHSLKRRHSVHEHTRLQKQDLNLQHKATSKHGLKKIYAAAAARSPALTTPAKCKNGINTFETRMYVDRWHRSCFELGVCPVDCNQKLQHAQNKWSAGQGPNSGCKSPAIMLATPEPRVLQPWLLCMAGI